MERESNFIYGRNPVREALRAKRVKLIYLADSMSDKVILDEIKLQKIETKVVTNNELTNKFKENKHQGVVAIVKPYEYLDLNEIIHRSKKVEIPIILVLDGINDPHNMGAILRSCDVFNVSGIVISKHNQVPLNATVAKTSAGAINFVPVSLVNNINNALETLKQNGFWVVSSDGSATTNYQDLKYDFPVALVIGSEGEGVSRLVLKNSDYIVKIPQYGHVNSLNASVAAAILLSRIRS